MARPKTLKDPEQITLVIEKETKKRAYELALKNGISISRLVSFLIDEASSYTPEPTTTTP